MQHKSQFFLAMAVTAAGFALWSTRHNLFQKESDAAPVEIIVEREPSTNVTQPTWNEPAPPVRRPPAPAQAETQTGPARAIDVTDDTFASLVLGSDKPVLVDFGADWCGACRMLEPTIHELAGELGGQATVARMDVDANPEVAAQYGIQALPTLLVFKNGEVVDGVVGVASKAELRAKMDSQSDAAVKGTFL